MPDEPSKPADAASSLPAPDFYAESPTTAQPLDFDDDIPDAAPQLSASPNASTAADKTMSEKGRDMEGGKGQAGAADGSATSTSTGGHDAAATSPPAPPPKPPRPLTAQQEKEKTLREAFPTVERAVIKAVLVASAGDVERAFHALLVMSDPSVEKEVEEEIQQHAQAQAQQQQQQQQQRRYQSGPPPKPARPSADVARQRQRQLEEDERYARRLAEQYGDVPYAQGERERQPYARSREGDAGGVPRPAVSRGPRKETGLKPNELFDDDHDFFRGPDDLPVIQENIRKGFVETQTKVNSFFANLKKKFDGEDEDYEQFVDESKYYHGDGRSQTGGRPFSPGGAAPRRSTSGQPYGHGRYPSDEGRARLSGDRERDRYDADARELGDGFSALELRDAEAPPRLPRRPDKINNDIFSMDDPSKPARRKVSFQEGPPAEIPPPSSFEVPGIEKRASPSTTPGFAASRAGDKYAAAKTHAPGAAGTPGSNLAKAGSKWQPLSVVEPSPIAAHDAHAGDDDDADSDPFKLGDDDEEEAEKDKEKDGKKEEEGKGASGAAAKDAKAGESK
ncbi:ubiquitin-binding protein cue5 [Ascosphaera acerosa]|nr:ubiquitin-binding protein cue5 [Ascosphaera acerosa]